MNDFEEFLQDYEACERERINKFTSRLDAGEVLQNEKYPPTNRFVKLKEPIADPYVNIWSIIPFYGSTVAKLIPKDNEELFNKTHNETMGFDSKKIEEMIDFQKETGRIQFALTMPPTYYKKLDFLEPLFRELNPPTLSYDPVNLIGPELNNKYRIEFETLASFGFSDYLQIATAIMGNSSPDYITAKLHHYANRYSILKSSGYEELADEIGTLMILEPNKAHWYISLFGLLIADTKSSLLKSIRNFDNAIISEYNMIESDYYINYDNEFPHEVGKFILSKLVHYPETMDGCMSIIQEYDDQELYKIMGSLKEGVEKNNLDLIEESEKNMSIILDNAWEDTKLIKTRSNAIKWGVSLGLGAIGAVADGLTGSGLLATLGLKVADTTWGVHDESVSERIAKYVSPNHLVALYDFKKKHALET